MLDNYIYLDLNLPTIDNGYSAVAAACMSGHFDIVSLLCDNGVDVNQVDSNQNSPLTYCFSRLNEDGNYFENKALALKMAEVLLSYGADINIYSHGRTILMNFCRQKYTYMKPIQQILLIEVIQFLVQHGADAFKLKCLKTGKTTYDFALQNQQDASKNNADFNKDSIENKMIDVLINTKQIFFHPQIIKPNDKKGSNQKDSGTSRKYR